MMMVMVMMVMMVMMMVMMMMTPADSYFHMTLMFHFQRFDDDITPHIWPA
jgi:hypothetical protein